MMVGAKRNHGGVRSFHEEGTACITGRHPVQHCQGIDGSTVP